MLLKRSMFLAVVVLFFIAGLIIYFEVSHAQMENRFRAEREKFQDEGVVLTASGPATSQPPPSAPAVTPDTNAPAPPPTVSSTDSNSAPATSEINSLPPTNAAPDTNSAPDTNAAPVPSTTPTTPDTNSTPATPPSSTMDYPQASRSPYLVLAGHRSIDGMKISWTGMFTGAVTATDSPATNTPPAETNASPAAATNTAPAPTAPAPATNASPAATAPAPASNAAPATTAPAPPTNASPATPAPVESSTEPPATGEASVIVLLYHQFRAPGVPIPAKDQWTMHQDVFESEMKYIHDNGYHVVPLSDVIRFIKHEITLPPGSVAITIDDGYKSAIVYAAPILKKYGYPWTFFIYPDYITVNEGTGAASWKDLLELQAEGIDIECHSMTHPKMTSHRQEIKVSTPNGTRRVLEDLSPDEYAAWLTMQTAGAKTLLEKKMGKPITRFAYPYGDYNKQVEAATIAAGFEAIFTVADNPVHSTTDLHSIGRYTITQSVEKNFPAYLRQSALSLTKADPEPGATINNPRPVITAVLSPISADKIDPASLETSVRDFGEVRHDFDPQTNTVRLYLPRDLIQSVALVNIRVKDASTGQIMVANWHFNYEPGGTAASPVHPPIAPAPAKNSPSASSKVPAPKPTASTNAPAATEPDLEKNAAGTPLDAHPAPPAPSH
ncbi:MAG: polysaccharide deacetylase family protein [Methylacidiphilales bacterium]|nr:polysaccharide deacetylase family protein [Candidatus Methylacidiphilales bacterium]